MSRAPDWFRAEIAAGLVRLVACALPGQPPADTIELTRETWIDALWPIAAWDAQLDVPRLREAFLRLTREREVWPAPMHLRNRLPSRPTAPALARPPRGDPARIRAVIEGMARALRVTPPEGAVDEQPRDP